MVEVETTIRVSPSLLVQKLSSLSLPECPCDYFSFIKCIPPASQILLSSSGQALTTVRCIWVWSEAFKHRAASWCLSRSLSSHSPAPAPPSFTSVPFFCSFLYLWALFSYSGFCALVPYSFILSQTGRDCNKLPLFLPSFYQHHHHCTAIRIFCACRRPHKLKLTNATCPQTDDTFRYKGPLSNQRLGALHTIRMNQHTTILEAVVAGEGAVSHMFYRLRMDTRDTEAQHSCPRHLDTPL
jgi:hypothetical protein